MEAKAGLVKLLGKWRLRKARKKSEGQCISAIRVNEGDKVDEATMQLLSFLIRNAHTSKQLTRSGKVIYAIKSLYEVSIGEVQATREAIQDNKRKWWREWCDYDTANLFEQGIIQRYIIEQLEAAGNIERAVFGSGGSEDVDLQEVTYNIVSVIAEMKRITVDEAKRVNYGEAIKLLDIKKKQNDRHIEEMRRATK